LLEREKHAEAARGSEQQIKEQKETLEELVSRRTAEAERRSKQLRALATQLTQAEQRERRRLAQVLHDQLQQLLVASRLRLGSLRRRVQSEEFEAAFGQLDEVLKQALESSRSLTVELSPPILYDAGLAAALEWLGRQNRQKHGLIVDVQADREAEPADEEMQILLFQAVRELLFNVVKHAKTDRARVTMRALEGDRVEIVVADSGVGFDPDGQEAGYLANGGFGLFNMRERLESIDGSLMVESTAGKGTRVAIVAARQPLPTPADVHIERTLATDTEKPGPSPRTRRKIRILLADDHDMVREGLASILSDESDFELVGEASDGEEAVELAKRTYPDVVVMDIAMPRLSGVAATRQILVEAPRTRVIGLSMHEREDMEAAMREAGAAAYLPKADTTDTLIDAIRSVVSGALSERSPPLRGLSMTED
jgi:CheY-like chemotaxis protein/anti-sigma regulatory factor (Ser/Thr protein kinase)